MDSGQELQRVYRYRIDGSDCLTFVCPIWLGFAKENGTPKLNEAAVIGQPVWQYIADADCRELYRSLFLEVRKRGTSASFPFRCDSPTVKRYMEMRISALPYRHLDFRVQLIREETQPYCQLLDPEIKRSDQWITMCAWCKRVKNSHYQWIDISEVLRTLTPFAALEVPNLTHSICPPCQQTFLESIQNTTPSTDT